MEHTVASDEPDKQSVYSVIDFRRRLPPPNCREQPATGRSKRLAETLLQVTAQLPRKVHSASSGNLEKVRQLAP